MNPSCDTKALYPSERLAKLYLADIWQKGNRQNAYVPANVYYCMYHDGWHMTSKKS